MFIELAEFLRCPGDHEEEFCVVTPDRMEGRHIPTGFQIEDCNTGRVEDVMTPVVHSVTERASLDAVARLMTRQHIHRVIVRKGSKVSGVISALDVLRAHGRLARSNRRSSSAPA